ncbi:MAG: acyl carrier protein [Phycisphaerales bacterium]|jgi:acyl carrier protein
MQIQSEIRNYIIENILFGDGELLDVDTSFQEDGILDSLGFLEIITFVEGKFGIEIEDNEVVPENIGSLRRISSFVEKKLNEKPLNNSAF